jgi:hypothetical protein
LNSPPAAAPATRTQAVDPRADVDFSRPEKRPVRIGPDVKSETRAPASLGYYYAKKEGRAECERQPELHRMASLANASSAAFQAWTWSKYQMAVANKI